MTSTHTRLTDDITKMFRQRLRQLLDDSGDTAYRAGIDDDDISKILITGLLAEVVIGSLTLQMDETNFLRICRSAYRQMVKMLAKQGARWMLTMFGMFILGFFVGGTIGAITIGVIAGGTR